MKIADFEKLSLKSRQEQVNWTLSKHPTKIPVLCEMGDNLEPLTRVKYLVEGNMTLGELVFTMRKKVKLDQTQALFVMDYVSKKSLPTSMNLGLLYDRYKDSDLFLKLLFVAENTFG